MSENQEASSVFPLIPGQYIFLLYRTSPGFKGSHEILCPGVFETTETKALPALWIWPLATRSVVRNVLPPWFSILRHTATKKSVTR